MDIIDSNIGFKNDEPDVLKIEADFIKSAKRVRVAQLMFFVLSGIVVFRYVYDANAFEGYWLSGHGIITLIFGIAYLAFGIATNYYPRITMALGIVAIIWTVFSVMPKSPPPVIPFVALIYFGFGLYHAFRMEELKKKINQNDIEEVEQ